MSVLRSRLVRVLRPARFPTHSIREWLVSTGRGCNRLRRKEVLLAVAGLLALVLAYRIVGGHNMINGLITEWIAALTIAAGSRVGGRTLNPLGLASSRYGLAEVSFQCNLVGN